MIPLVLDFSQDPPEGIRFENGKIFMNTKDPEIAEKFADRLMSEVLNREEVADLETLFMNHRLRMAADLDLFDELERHMDEENRLIENKSERMSRMSMTMSQMTQILDGSKLINPADTSADFEGFTQRGSEKQTAMSTVVGSKLAPAKKQSFYRKNSFESSYADRTFD